MNACRVNPYLILQGTERHGKICSLRQEANHLQSCYFCCYCVQWGVETRTSHSQTSSVPYTEESCDRCVTTCLRCSLVTHVVRSCQVSLTLLDTTSYFNRRCKVIATVSTNVYRASYLPDGHRLALCDRKLGYELDDPGFESFHGQEIFSFLRNVHTGSGAHLAPYSVGTVVLSRE